jgi:succinate dehydrogenase / fumarate reductase cytochrome b subunit
MASTRPLSPHLSIWKWRVHMATSIFHRVSGNALATAGLLLFTWWLVAAASGKEAYDAFASHATAWYGLFVLIGLTWMAFQHLLSGLRHLAMDTGWGYALGISKTTASAVFVGSVALTAITWAAILVGKGG